MKVLLVDDEQHNCELIQALLEFHLPGQMEVVGYAHSVDQASGIIREIPVDLVFLDIQMPGKSGFELLKEFETPPFEVIFVTSFDDYALPAFKADAVDYLLKPVDVEELKRAVSKVFKLLYLKRIPETERNLPNSLQEIKIAVHEGDKVVFLKSKEIVSFSALGRYTNIALISGQKHVISKNLKMIEELLGDQNSFIRINRGVLLNSTYVNEYSKSDPFSVIMADGSFFEISRRKRAEILAALK